ncbi:MAG: pol polyprotein, partial [Candidatus Thiodiazotropha sp.]
MPNSTAVPNAKASKHDNYQLTTPKVIEKNVEIQKSVSNCNNDTSGNEQREIIHNCDSNREAEITKQNQCIDPTQPSSITWQTNSHPHMSSTQGSEVKQHDHIPCKNFEHNQTGGSSNQSSTINKVSNACWYFHAQVGDLDIPLLFDTGSTVSLISKEVYDNMSEDKPTLTPVETTLLTANGSKLEILGQGIFKLKTEVKTYDWKFLVSNIEGNMGIIGQDFIDSQGRSLKWKNLTWQTKAGVIQLFKLNSSQVAKIVVSESVRVGPESEIFVPAHTNYPLYRELNMIEPFSGNQKKGLLVARSLINNSGESVISVLNVTDKPIKLKSGDILGHVCPVTENNLETYETPASTQVPEHLQPLIEEVSPELSPEEKREFGALISEFQDIFMGPDKKLGQTDLAFHKIEVGQSRPIKIPPRKCPIVQREVIEEELDKMLEQKVIEPSDSPWSAPICLVKKADGTYRFAIDFRGLNSVTEKDAYPLPNIRQIFDTLSGSKWYNTIDLASGYWQIPLHPDSVKLTAFATPTRGLFHFLVMPFGLSNAGATFERLMERVLGNLQWVKCICYLDDVIIFGSDFKTTLENLRAVFSRLRAAKLKLKPSKCKFFQRRVAFLGHVATESGTECDPEKTAAIQNWPRPTNVKEVRSFLGLVNFYRSYIPQCASMAYPMNHLTRKHVKFKWDEKCEESFNALKRCLVTPPILAYPTRTGKFLLQTDASGQGIGSILSQEQDGREVVIAYGSKTLSKSQQNYCTTMRELYAVVYFMRYFKHYLLGRHFEVHTDHASLVWIKNFKDAEGMLSRWLTIIDTFDFTICHRKGTHMQHVDALSRIPPRKCKRDACMDCARRSLNDSPSPSPENGDLAPISNRIFFKQSKGEDSATVISTLSTDRDVGPASSFNGADLTETPPFPNWLEFESKEELRDLQVKDPDIGIVLHSKENSTKPTKEEINQYSQDTKTLFHQWDVLHVKQGVLYKEYTVAEQSYQTLVTPA